MKNFLKMFFIVIMAVFLCGAGVYLVLANMSQLLAAGKPNMQLRWFTSGLQIKTARWCETIGLPLPVHIRSQAGKWMLYNHNFALTVIGKPKLQILWKKSFTRGKKGSSEEY